MTSSFASDLQLDEWLSLIGLVLALPPLIAFLVSFVARVMRASPRIALHEFVLLIRQPWHVALLVIITLSATYLVIYPPQSFPGSLALLVPIFAAFFLSASFFLAQSRQLSGAVIINEIRRLSRSTRDHHQAVCSAIRFDIDRLKAISNYSPTLGERIRETVSEVIKEEVQRLRRQGVDIAALSIPGEDETVVIAAGLTVDGAADFADEVRRRVRRGVQGIPYYAEAIKVITQDMQSAPTPDEERQGIGTVSAGVAADRGMPEILFSDVSAAVKESKARGRNKTVIYRPGQSPEVRSDYHSGEETTSSLH